MLSNDEYKILKELWCLQQDIKPEEATFIGLDLGQPSLDMGAIARGYGAHTECLDSDADVAHIMQQALKRSGPTLISIRTT